MNMEYIVNCYATEDVVQIGNWFYYNLTPRDYNYILHCYLFTQLRANLFRQSPVVFTYSVSPNHTLYIFTYSHFKICPLTELNVAAFAWKLKSQSQSHIATDGQSASKSWCRTPSGAHDQIFFTR
jgi:hypothetical protein